MDKITRLLLLYSKLIQGEKINKTMFCMEADCLTRSFDRDIEDIRLYLSDAFSSKELLYNRQENAYYMSGGYRTAIEPMEYLFIERILLDASILRQDELIGLLSHLFSNIENPGILLNYQKTSSEQYDEPLHQKAILKMHGDLVTTIKNYSVIKMRYIKMDRSEIERTVIPCSIKYDLGYMYLIAFREGLEEKYPAYFRLDRIYSFFVERGQYRNEQQMVKEYLQKYSKGITQMLGGDFTEVVICCKRKYYPYVHDKFKNAQVIDEQLDDINVRLWVFEEGFIKWIITQPTEMIVVKEPDVLRTKIANEANKVVTTYTEVQDNGKKN